MPQQPTAFDPRAACLSAGLYVGQDDFLHQVPELDVPAARSSLRLLIEVDHCDLPFPADAEPRSGRRQLARRSAAERAAATFSDDGLECQGRRCLRAHSGRAHRPA